ncbi:T9SS type A sorting domain-containing protein [Flavobacterium sp. HXWNR29]|uniref:T9SS type A sorting domain-containing protein n=1 Tax=Flavobacterium odoriferum TaxID=2946604 RepID=UPI0021CB8C41|nr:T9SS type A sorting domain-containing protein [Flavobacterium sp. HXWNR29]MCU4189035.1 T9SS type A sorting domain-containing protein [Flavobacterium sp. HXWNR29]
MNRKKIISSFSMKLYLFLFIIGLNTINVFSQAPNIQWQKAFGGTSNEYARSIIQTTDDGYIVSGYTYSNNGDVSGNHGDADYWLVKINSTGTIEWQKTFGGSGEDWARRIRKTTDGGFIVIGRTNSNNGDVTGFHGGSWDCWIIKLDSAGNIIWQKTLGGSSVDQGYDIQQTSDNGYIVTCGSNSNDGDITGNHGGSDFWVVKLNATGSIIWQKSLGGTGDDLGGSVQQTLDGGYIVGGNSNSTNGDVTGNHGNDDFWVVKLDSEGNISWQKSLGGSGFDGFQCIKQAIDGGYLVSGYTFSNNGDVTGNHGNYDVWVIKLNSLGNITWQKTLGGTNSDQAKYIQQTIDEGIIIVGNTKSNNGDVSNNQGDWDYWVVKLDGMGTLLWQKTLGGISFDEADYIEQTTEGGYIIAGRTNSNNGDVTGNHGNTDFWVVKLASDSLSNSEFEITNTILYPNPSSKFISLQYSTNPETSFYFKIIDLTGKIIKSSFSKFNDQINIESLTSGNYIIQIETENGKTETKKFIKN